MADSPSSDEKSGARQYVTESEKITISSAEVTLKSKTAATEVEPFIEEKSVAPVDKSNLVFLIILLHGVGTLMPWNMFINFAPMYFENYKMVHHTIINGTFVTNVTEYSSIFMNTLTICAQWPNLILNFINLFVTVKGDLSRRISICLVVVAVVILFTDVFVFIDTNNWIAGFFYMTMISVVVLNSANGIYQNSLYGLVSDFPFKYTNAVIIGNNLCGTFVSILSIISVEGSTNPAWQAFFYFSMSLLTIIACFMSFFYLHKLDFYRYYSKRGTVARSEAIENNGKPSWKDYIETIKQGWVQFLNVFLVFFVSLTVFPSVMVNISPNNKGERYNFWMPERQFHNVFTFLLFNVFAFIGSLLAGYKQIISPSRLWIFVWARILFIPFFAMCNFNVQYRTTSVWFQSVYIYMIGGILMSLTSGYFSSLSMMYAPRVVDADKSRLAGMIAAFFLVLGILIGLVFTMAIPKMV